MPELVRSLDERLAVFRADTSTERFVCLLDDLEAMRVAALWSFVPKAWKAPRGPAPGDENELWFWLWEGCQYDEQWYGEMVELPVNRLRAKVNMLSAARILFPDGTLPNGARVLLQGRIREEVHRLKKLEDAAPRKG